MNDLGDDSGSAFARFFGRIADNFIRGRAYGRGAAGKARAVMGDAELSTSSEAAQARAAGFTPVVAGLPTPEAGVRAAVREAASDARNEEFKTLAVEDRQSYELLSSVYANANVKYYAEWDAKDKSGVFVLQADEFERGRVTVERALADIEAGALTREEVLAKSPELAAVENDRALLSFATLNRDREAKIITNALKREGVTDWQVTTPDPEGIVHISVKNADAPRLASIVDNYVGVGTVERERFANLDDFAARVSARQTAADVRRKQRSKSPADAGENAKKSADARNRNRQNTPPVRTQAR